MRYEILASATAAALLALGCCCFGGGSREVLPPGTPASLTLTVLPETGGDVSGFTVTLERSRERVRQTHVVAQGDTLRVSGLEPDAYAFYVHTSDGRGGYRAQTGLGRFIYLDPGDNDVTVVVSGGALLSGRVTDAATGAPIEGVEVNVETESYGRDGGGPDTPAAVTNEEGVFALGGLCGATKAIFVSYEGRLPRRIAPHRFPDDCEHVVRATLDVQLDASYRDIVAIEVADEHPRFTRVAPGSFAARAGLREGDRVVDLPPEYDPTLRPDEVPSFLLPSFDLEYYEGGSFRVTGADGAERTVTIQREPPLRWPGDP